MPIHSKTKLWGSVKPVARRLPAPAEGGGRHDLKPGNKPTVQPKDIVAMRKPNEGQKPKAAKVL